MPLWTRTSAHEDELRSHRRQLYIELRPLAAISREKEDALWQQVFMVSVRRRREFEPAPRSQDATTSLGRHYGLNPKTVAKWRKRTSTADAPMGPSRPHSSVLTETEESIVVEFRRRTLLPLDDVLGCLRETIPKLSRSALHRCLVRHGISRLPEGEEKVCKRKRFAETRIGYVHIDVCELRLAQGKLFMFLAIDRVSKFAHVAFLDANTKANGAAFLREVVEIFPYQLHTVLTDNGMAFADLPKNRGRHPELEAMFGGHIFDRICKEHSLSTGSPSLTIPGRTANRGSTARCRTPPSIFHYADREALRAHVLAFVAAYNFAKHLKALRWRTPFQAICDAWQADPSVSDRPTPPHSRYRTPSVAFVLLQSDPIYENETLEATMARWPPSKQCPLGQLSLPSINVTTRSN